MRSAKRVHTATRFEMGPAGAYLSFKGVAHPPPVNKNESPTCSADLNSAEICTTKINTGNGTLPLLVEHNEAHEAGKVLASWEGPGGDLRVAGIVTNKSVAEKIRQGYLRGLSLGTNVWHDGKGKTVAKWQQELSVCSMPARKNCFMYEIDGSQLPPHASQVSRRNQRECARL